ncbi:MAG: M20/M25/M40 family metallo-hydrolase [Streptosporangiales bacterium]|nr:M20/M25/M40 family metallo-hydrolase [Streptosporangiales bacterium]
MPETPLRHALVSPPRRGLALLAAVLVLTTVVVASLLLDTRPPEPEPASAPAGEFSAARALDRLDDFGTRPRPLGSAESDRTRDHLAAELREAGLTVRIDRGLGSVGAPGTAGFGRVENVVGTLRGSDPTGAVVLAAHYDSVAAGPGASDDGAAVAAVLETLRALRTSGQPRNDVVVLLTDGEENGLLGASAFRRGDPLAERGGVVLNWEARGASGPSMLFETSRDNAGLVSVYADAAPHPFGDSSAVELYRLSSNNTDFTELRAAGFTGLNFAYVGSSARYHSPGDSIANLDHGSLQHHGATMLALTRAFGDRDLDALPTDDDVTYFRAFGAFVTYPNALVLPLAIASLLAFAGLLVAARRQRLLSLPRTLLGTLAALLPLGVAAALAQLLWALLVQVRPGYGAFMMGDTYQPGLFRLAVGALVVCVLAAWYGLLRRRLGQAALAVGALAWPTLLGLIIAVVAPGAAYLFTVPALASTLGALLALALRRRSSPAALAALLVAAVPATSFGVLLGLGMFDSVGMAGGGAAATAFALGGLGLLPLLDLAYPDAGAASRRRRAAAVPATAVVVAVALVGTGLAVDGFDARRPQPTHLAYVLDASTRTANWVSDDAEPPRWTRQYVTTHGGGAVEYDETPNPGRWVGPADDIGAEAPAVRVVATGDGELTLHVRSPRGAPRVTLAFDRPVERATARVPGRDTAAQDLGSGPDDAWPSRVILDDLPAAGATLRLRVGADAPREVRAFDQTVGLDDVPGFEPRPAGLARTALHTGDLVVVGRTYRL